MKEFKVVDNGEGLSLTIVHDGKVENEEDGQVFLGGDTSNPTWEEYLDKFNEEFRPRALLLRKSIEENSLVGCTAEETTDLWFKFSDGEIWGFSWRGWGDLMQAIVNKKEGYMAYYM